jgi:hypothetical protein
MGCKKGEPLLWPLQSRYFEAESGIFAITYAASQGHMTRNMEVYLCQEPAIVSKPAETCKTSDNIYESPVFLFRTRIDAALEKAQATLQGYSPDFQYSEDTARPPQRGLSCRWHYHLGRAVSGRLQILQALH